MTDLRPVDVVVVGAGFAGLSAALKLHNRGLKCLVVEAHDRVGGKSWSKQLQSAPGVVEMGCTWTNSTNQPRIYGMVQKYGLPTKKQPTEGIEILLDTAGQIHKQRHGELAETLSEADKTLAACLIESIEKEAKKLDQACPGRLLDSNNPPAWKDMTVHEWLLLQGAKPGSFAYYVIDSPCNGLLGTNTHNTGLYCLLGLFSTLPSYEIMLSDFYDGAQHLKIKTGTSSICRAMAHEIGLTNILLSSPATDIYQRKGSCTVRIQDGRSFQCQKVVVAVPSDTWQRINFTPPLPQDKLEAAIKGVHGYYSKTVLTYNKPWWRDLGLLGKFNMFEGPISFSWDASDDTSHYSLALFCVAQHLPPHAKLPKLERHKALMESVVRCVGKEHAALVYDVAEINEQIWSDDPWVGTVCYPVFGPGDYTELAPALMRPWKNLHFASTESGREWRGYMEGAVESGERAAGEIITGISQGSDREGALQAKL